MIYGQRLRELFDKECKAGRGLRGYRERLRESLGLVKGPDGSLAMKPGHISHREFSLQDVAHSFLGREYAKKLREHRLRESGGVVTSSTFSAINATLDTVGGLIERAVAEGYNDIPYIGKELVDVQEGVRVDGGKMVRYGGDDTRVEDDLAWGEPYGMAGMRGEWIDIPEVLRKGRGLQVGEDVFLFDQTDSAMDAAMGAGKYVRRQVEINIADCVLGITNTFSRNGIANNTYQSTAGVTPHDFVNSDTSDLDLVNLTDVDEALQVLAQNTDPLDGTEIEFDPSQAKILVNRGRRLAASTVVTAATVERRTATAAEISLAQNPFSSFPVVVAPELWYNRLIASGVSATNAAARWHLGNFKKAFRWRSAVPFSFVTYPASFEQARRDIVFAGVAREVGVCMTVEPRHAGQFGTSG